MPAKRTKKTKTKFEIEAPSAQSVYLVGEFTGWEADAIKLKKSRNGTWKATVSLPSGAHQYRFMVDGEWQDDPNAPARTTNPFGTENCVREVNQA